MHFFLKKVDDPFYLSPSKHRPPTPFHCENKIKQIKRSDMVTFLFSVHTIKGNTLRRARQGRARA